MRILWDTHLLLWALASPAKLSAAIRKQIHAVEVHVRTTSIWEISIKSSIGKLQADPAEILAALAPAGMLAITGEHAAKVVELPPLSDVSVRPRVDRAGADRAMILSTNDEKLRGYGPFVRLV